MALRPGRPRVRARPIGLALLGGALFATAGCGWHPVYAPLAGNGPGTAALERVDVSIIPERSGQLLRQALQAELRQTGSEQAPAFVLGAQYSVSQEGISFTQNSSTTRIRMIGTSFFNVRPVGSPTTTCVSGSVREVDGFDQIDQQFFASDLQAEATQRRLAQAVARDIVRRVAFAFDTPGRPGCEIR